MGPVDLTIEQLSLDNENPRIDSAASQREALQKVIADEPEKLVRLVRSIVKRGLNPMDRLLVFRPKGARSYIVAEGNRRSAALKILSNPTALGSLEVDPALRKRLEAAAKEFAVEKVEPIACYDVGARDHAAYWLRLRHTGENNGEGVVPWKTTAQSRFLGGEPALEALQFVRNYGGLSDVELDKIDRRFNLTTLRRLMESRPVREKIGIEVRNGVIHTGLPADEIIKPLREFVTAIVAGEVNSRNLHTVQDQADYVAKLKPSARPDLSRSRALRPITELTLAPGSGAIGKPRSRIPKKSGDRNCLIPRRAPLNVGDPKIAAIVGELQTMRVDTCKHAISVLFRVFLELSTDHYMTQKGIPIDTKVPNRGDVPKKLDKKVQEVIDHLIASGAQKRDFDAVRNALRNKSSPLNIDLLHGYVHNRFVIPKERDLLASWDEARPYFQTIWS